MWLERTETGACILDDSARTQVQKKEAHHKESSTYENHAETFGQCSKNNRKQ